MSDILTKIKYLPSLFSRKGNFGICPICEKKTIFFRFNPWLRDHYKCIYCHSIPRQRALINAMNIFYPEWPGASIHESSPGGINSEYIGKKCKNYTNSFFFPEIQTGSYKNGARCENLEKLTFPDESFNIFVTQDVFEHVNHPDLSFNEIARVLKPGGMHIFTVPLYRELKKTQPRIRDLDGKIFPILEPVYHGNPIDSKGSLVTVDYGLDLPELIYNNSKMVTTIYLQKDLSMGLDAEFLEVFISKK